MSIFSTLELSGSALAAERQRAEIVAANMANAETTHTATGGPYRRKEVVFSSSGNLPFRMMLAGFHSTLSGAMPAVRVRQVVDDPTPPLLRYDPGHPDAEQRRLRGLSRYQSDSGDGRPDGRSTLLSAQCFSHHGKQTDDPAVHGSSEIKGIEETQL